MRERGERERERDRERDGKIALAWPCNSCCLWEYSSLPDFWCRRERAHVPCSAQFVHTLLPYYQ